MAFLVDGDKFRSVQEELARKGVEVQGPEDTGIAFSCFFTDPDGHLLELTTYHSIETEEGRSPDAGATTSDG